MDECKPLLPGVPVAFVPVTGGGVREQRDAGAYTHPLFSSIFAVLVTPPRVPLSNRLGGNDAPQLSHNKRCSST